MPSLVDGSYDDFRQSIAGLFGERGCERIEL